MIQEILQKKTVILGCGNLLFGDDGFGPAVIKHLEDHVCLPESVSAIDLGTGIKEFLFDLVLSPIKPKHIFILDAVCQPGHQAGEFFEINPERFQKEKQVGRALHQFPSLQQLQEVGGLTGVAIRILAMQAGEIPDTVQPGLSPKVKEAIPRVCDWLISEIQREIK
jgi:coenzyme F420 hydrogenase subunit delta